MCFTTIIIFNQPRPNNEQHDLCVKPVSGQGDKQPRICDSFYQREIKAGHTTHQIFHS